MNEAEGQESVQALLAKADQALADAKLLVENGRAEGAVSRAYYAAFDAARAALILKGEEPRSHAGVLTRFSYHFIRTGQIAKKTGGILATAETLRNRADYDAFAAFETEAAGDLVRDVNRFVEAVRQLVAADSV